MFWHVEEGEEEIVMNEQWLHWNECKIYKWNQYHTYNYTKKASKRYKIGVNSIDITPKKV